MVSAEELRLYRAAYYKKTAQAYIFSAGADAEAERAAQDFLLRLYCENGIGCGVCAQCRKVLDNNHIDILDIGCEGLIKKELVEPVVDFIAKKAYEGGYKCVLIRRAHSMGEASQNFLLKSIEEPPEGVVFLLATSAPDKLLPTIRSRAITVRIPPLPRRAVESALGSGELERAAAAQCGGSPSEAQRLLSDGSFREARTAAFAVADMLARIRRPSIYKMSELALGCDMNAFLTALGCIFNDALYHSLTGDEQFLSEPARVGDTSSLSKVISDAGLLKICDIITKTADAKRLSPGINSAAAIRAMLFDIMEVRNKCLK